MEFFMQTASPRKALRAMLALAVLAAAGQALAADDACAAVRAAITATLNAPGLRQYMALREGAPERLVSVLTRDAVYVAIGGRWDRQSRSEYRESVAAAEQEKKMSGCKRAGSAVLNGEPVTVFDYTVQFTMLPSIPAKVWVGSDGLLRKQSSGAHGYLRYEYKDVRAPA
jgi:hypothetical protein